MELHDHLHLREMYTETMTCLLSYHDLLVEPLLGHSVRLTFFIFRYYHAYSSGKRLLICGFDSTMDLDYWDHVFDDG